MTRPAGGSRGAFPAASGPLRVGDPLGLLRISTNPRVFERPLSAREASAAVSAWPERPSAGIAEPGERHWEILAALVMDGQATGPLVMDAALAALAIESGATLQTSDRDFHRFPGLSFVNPLV